VAARADAQSVNCSGTCVAPDLQVTRNTRPFLWTRYLPYFITSNQVPDEFMARQINPDKKTECMVMRPKRPGAYIRTWDPCRTTHQLGQGRKHWRAEARCRRPPVRCAARGFDAKDLSTGGHCCCAENRRRLLWPR
jgi:hypothetical protein